MTSKSSGNKSSKTTAGFGLDELVLPRATGCGVGTPKQKTPTSSFMNYWWVPSRREKNCTIDAGTDAAATQNTLTRSLAQSIVCLSRILMATKRKPTALLGTHMMQRTQKSAMAVGTVGRVSEGALWPVTTE
jgi:hypothetical protein